MRLILPLLILLFSFPSQSHPVIYKDGFVYWGSFSPDMNSQKASYTFDPKFSFEINTTWYDNIDDYRDYTAGFNYLVKRWLNQDSQGNLYLGAHAGYFQTDLREGLSTHLMLSGDWESRHIYTAASVMRYGLKMDDDFYKYSYRLGFAPFVAGMNTLQAWMIIKLDYHEENNRNLVVTPMMRFFYKNVLWELGSSTQGDSFLTLIQRLKSFA